VVAVGFGIESTSERGERVVEEPGLGAIVEQIKARIGQIEQQLRQHRDLSDELERLRDALGRLEGGVAARVPGRRTRAKASPPTATAAAKKPAPAKQPAPAKTSPAAKKSAAAGRPRRAAASAPRGQTRAKILDALKDGPKTAGEIAAATGIGRGSASTTLTKLAKSGDVVKAERGYRLPD
jgi:predicted Rossmann fold nucleotide-binding protein DprA/Smf involved in DNA uptake